MAAPEIRAATEADRQRVYDIIFLAFSNDPVTRWLIPSASDYCNHFRDFIHAMAGEAVDRGTALMTEDGTAAALLFSPGYHENVEAMQEVMARFLPDARYAEVGTMNDDISHFHHAAHEAIGDYWYLSMLGIDPTWQNRGIGSAMMRRVLELIGKDPAFLLSSNPRNVSLYQRFDFEISGLINLGGEPLMTPMQRAAQ